MLHSNLKTTSAEDIRVQIEKKFNCSLATRKEEIAAIIFDFLPEADEKDEEQISPPKKKYKRDGTDIVAFCRKPTSVKSNYQLSDELTAVVGDSVAPRHVVVKKIWQYAKANQLYDKSNQYKINCDEILEKNFRIKSVKVHDILKHLDRHMTAQVD